MFFSLHPGEEQRGYNTLALEWPVVERAGVVGTRLVNPTTCGNTRHWVSPEEV